MQSWGLCLTKDNGSSLKSSQTCSCYLVVCIRVMHLSLLRYPFLGYFKAQYSCHLKSFFSNDTWCVRVHSSPVIPNCKAHPQKEVLQIWLRDIWKFKQALTSGQKLVLLEKDWNLRSSKNSGYLELWHKPAASAFHESFPKAGNLWFQIGLWPLPFPSSTVVLTSLLQVWRSKRVQEVVTLICLSHLFFLFLFC